MAGSIETSFALNLALCGACKTLQALLRSDCLLCSPKAHVVAARLDTTEQPSGHEANKCYSVSLTSALCWQVSTVTHL